MNRNANVWFTLELPYYFKGSKVIEYFQELDERINKEFKNDLRGDDRICVRELHVAGDTDDPAFRKENQIDYNGYHIHVGPITEARSGRIMEWLGEIYDPDGNRMLVVRSGWNGITARSKDNCIARSKRFIEEHTAGHVTTDEELEEILMANGESEKYW